MKIKCIYNDPENTPKGIPNDFDYGLELGKEYLVMGVMTYKSSNNVYFLIEENLRPAWFPFQIFKIIKNDFPKDWYLYINVSDKYSDCYNLIGFEELCNNNSFFNKLLERDEEAMRIYFRRKIELEQYYESLDSY